MAADTLSFTQVLAAIPQQSPFRFIDRIHEIDDEHVLASYRYRDDEFFYPGHFPGDPVTPGVILVETMAQCGVVALGIYLTARSIPREEFKQVVTLFTDAQVEFNGIVRPGEEVFVLARKLYFRRLKLRVEAELRRADGKVVCSGQLSGMGVMRT